MKRALITGVTGQDGSYLAEFLLSKGYDVHGITRRIVGSERVKIHPVDITDSTALTSIIEKVRPDEIYNLLPRVMFLIHLKILFILQM